MLQNRFIQRLNALLDSRDLTQNELADRINVAAPTVSFWLNGERPPKLANIEDLVEAFDLPSDYFFRENDDTCPQCETLRGGLQQLLDQTATE